MNAIQTYYAVNIYANTTHGDRYFFSEVAKAVNDAIDKKIDSITDTAKQNKMSGIDRVQQYRDELFTLIKEYAAPVTPINIINEEVTQEHIPYPNDYRTFAALQTKIGNFSTFARETTYNEFMPMIECSFRKPNNKKPYCLEDSTGYKTFRGIGQTMTTNLYYIKKPLDFKMGAEEDVIKAGLGVLAINTNYIAVDISVYNGIQYLEGDVFTTNGALTNLTQGEVILASLTTSIELPEKTHDQIAKMAADILLGITKDYEASNFVEKESM